jgi:MerR family mercuric resistance operon transcriptional regulator
MRPVAPAPSETLSIGELSGRTGVNIETIRYYERVKMLPAPPRTSNGRRVYGPTEIRSLAFIRRSRELGFTLDEIRALLALSAEDANNTCGEVRQVAARHLADIRAKIADLRAMARVLADAVQRCDVGEMPGCPLIDTLSASTPLHLVARRSPRLSSKNS